MNSESNNSTYYSKANRAAIWVLAAHIPILAGTAMYFGTGVSVAIGLGLAILAGPFVLLWINPHSRALPIAIGIAALSISGLLIHLGRGMVELHFHVFITLACLIGLANFWAVLAGAATIAVHHLGFYFLLPQSVFNYEASIGIVLLHAVFVVAETIPSSVIAHKFWKFIEAQELFSGNLSRIAGEVRMETDSVMSSSKELSIGSASQAASVEETSSSLEELSQVTESSVTRAKEAKGIAGRARDLATQGSKEVQEMNKAMGEIRNSSNSVAQILKSIDEIAFQTNILALNAAVEAARAGEAGAGFAVVADEVRSLAQRSALAAHETAEKISDSVSRSEHGVEMSERISQNLNEIFEITGQVDDIIAQIVDYSSEQKEGIDQINSSVLEISRVTQGNAASSQGNADRSNNLNSLAAQLNGVVSEIALILGEDRVSEENAQEFEEESGFDSARIPTSESSQRTSEAFAWN